MSVSAGTARARPGLLRRQGRSLAFWLVAIVAFSLVSVALLWPAPTWGPNDPENAQRDGMQALAQVLEQQGVEVTVIRSSADLVNQTPMQPTTLVITQREYTVAATTAATIGAMAQRYDRVVLLGPKSAVLRGAGLSSTYSVNTKVPTPIAADCTQEAIGQAASLDRSDGKSTIAFASVDTETGCFPVERSTGADAHVLLRSGDLYAFSDPTLFTNSQITSGDNAALALTLLGAHPHLVWFSVGGEDEAQDSSDDDQGLAGVLPPWWDPVQRLLTWTAVIALLWQVRRFGPLVTERLPVVIKAVETTINRGNLYHRAGARDRAVASLQRATQHRLQQALALPRDTPVDALVSAVAAATERDPREVRQVLTHTSPVTTDEMMVLRAQTLSQLEEEVRRS